MHLSLLIIDQHTDNTGRGTPVWDSQVNLAPFMLDLNAWIYTVALSNK